MLKYYQAEAFYEINLNAEKAEKFLNEFEKSFVEAIKRRIFTNEQWQEMNIEEIKGDVEDSELEFKRFPKTSKIREFKFTNDDYAIEVFQYADVYTVKIISYEQTNSIHRVIDVLLDYYGLDLYDLLNAENEVSQNDI